MNVIRLYRPVWPRYLLAAAVVAALGIAGVAVAGECPADQRVADGKGQSPGPSMPVGVTDVVRASTDLAKEPLALPGRQFRLQQPRQVRAPRPQHGPPRLQRRALVGQQMDRRQLFQQRRA